MEFTFLKWFLFTAAGRIFSDGITLDDDVMQVKLLPDGTVSTDLFVHTSCKFYLCHSVTSSVLYNKSYIIIF